ncbi:Hypothetical protein DEACI_0022 [Acididesulfobacillus acetoxydans]|uniref:Uncharacterized protein n=1 Tax=Acididesulfobacillus acetoxydans TaxID=1561005 RepID=A0A8S0X2Q2_9FIRM|nr:hypothetical protein [Acididesulfobacillus acetoxydans]CAA7599400.1 Hypothetical protein DEACI_0022 [Acididesulfobacillus acetoxydans]CEJ06794.1 Hypothetical protein DEACI_1245 [Acididesulfobacillus acetoxydans]
MFGRGGHFPNISPVGAPPHIGPITGPCCPPVIATPSAGTGIGAGIIAIAILILIALAVIF